VSSVLVVHCIDTEGPLGGDARRLPDGGPEFFDNWPDILASLAELTDEHWRHAHADSHGNPYRFNWFVMDFTGFRTNPKQRIAQYHDTWDKMHTLPIELDGAYWHYHVPPEGGIGDQWSDSWLSSNECNTVLVRRLLERDSFPAAFRAGGTIEDNAASRWLEHAVPIDYSNRVSERSQPGADLFHFNWYGAPVIWGSYHPSHGSFLRPGAMRRYVYRSIDLRSRYNEVTQELVDACFREVAETGRHRVFSFFSHDNRDMRPETVHVHELLSRAAERTGVAWESCTAVEAHRRYHGLREEPIRFEVDVTAGGIALAAGSDPLQPAPFVGAQLEDGRFIRLFPSPDGARRWRLRVETQRLTAVAAAVTSRDGSITIARS
jgi:hypothetical protein